MAHFEPVRHPLKLVARFKQNAPLIRIPCIAYFLVVLLTAHPGGVNGDGGAPGGGSSFRQGVGAASPGSSDLETAATAIQRGDQENTSILGVSSAREIYR